MSGELCLYFTEHAHLCYRFPEFYNQAVCYTQFSTVCSQLLQGMDTRTGICCEEYVYEKVIAWAELLHLFTIHIAVDHCCLYYQSAP